MPSSSKPRKARLTKGKAWKSDEIGKSQVLIAREETGDEDSHVMMR